MFLGRVGAGAAGTLRMMDGAGGRRGRDRRITRAKARRQTDVSDCAVLGGPLYTGLTPMIFRRGSSAPAIFAGVAEPGGGAACAGLLSGKYVAAPGERVAVLACGANSN